jgi:hypothetical protein
MILKELQEFVLDYHRVSLAEMELHFHLDGNALRQMLNTLVQKGRVRKLPIPEHCHGCTFCDPDTIEFYEWIDVDDRLSDHSCQIPKNSQTQAQIHSTPVSEQGAPSEQTDIKHAVILHNCQKNH